MRQAAVLCGAGLLAACLAASAVRAADSFALPAGCAAYVTIQKHSCRVSHLFRCEGDPEGYQHRVDLSDSGMTYLGIIDGETQWIESFYPSTGETQKLLPGATDPASFTTLLETGRDDWDFLTTSDLGGTVRTVGYDELTGAEVTVDGVTLLETRFHGQETDTADRVTWSGEGTEYINPDWRTFISGRRHVTVASGDYSTDYSPVDFAFPGEAGFLATKPRYDCGAVMSKREVSP